MPKPRNSSASPRPGTPRQIAAVLAALAALAVWAGAGLGAEPAGAQPSDERGSGAEQPATAPPQTGATPAALEHRIREGTQVVEERGVFKITGERVTFFSGGARLRLVVLENLNLERIVRVITDSPEKQDWVVSGRITEFQGANYLLVEKAVLKSESEAGDEEK